MEKKMSKTICSVPEDDPMMVEYRTESDTYIPLESEWVYGTE